MTRLHPIRILIADDHPMLRVALQSMINSEPNMVVIAEARDGEEAVQLFIDHQPDITLMDINMPKMDGLEAMQKILVSDPQARFIVLTNFDSEEDIYRGLEAGAMGYLMKDSSFGKLLDTIQAVYMGRKYIPPDIAQKLSHRRSNPKLSPREMDVLRLMMTGKSNRAISFDLDITESTVKSHVKNILFKLGVSDRTQAVTRAIQRGILKKDG